MVGRLEDVSVGGLAVDQIADLLVRTIRRFGDIGLEELFEQAERHLRRKLLGRED